MNTNLIAFTGYGGAGKDEAAKTLIEAGYSRRCFGDIIKSQVDEKCKQEHGFSAFTDKPKEKAKIRNLLEQHGEKNYDSVMKEFFDTLPEKCVNTRLMRIREAREWVKRGGVIVFVCKPGVKAETKFCAECCDELIKGGVIWAYLHNDGDKEALAQKVTELFNLDAERTPTPPAPKPFTPGLADRKSEPSSMAVRVIKRAEPDVQAPGNNSAPKDKDGFDDFVADAT